MYIIHIIDTCNENSYGIQGGLGESATEGGFMGLPGKQEPGDQGSRDLHGFGVLRV